MDKNLNKLCAGVAGAALLAGCASLQDVANWVPPPAGSTWQMHQTNTGSYGKDVDVVLTSSDDVWHGQAVVRIKNAANGGSILSLPNGKWVAFVDGNEKVVATFDPPQGYEFPLGVGRTWKTHHRSTNHMTGKSVEYDYDCVVEATEKVTVRAGTFEAFRIACENELSHDVSWFAPELGVHVKMQMQRKAAYPAGEGTQHSELVALHLAQ